MPESPSDRLRVLAELIHDCLCQGLPIDIDALGRFERDQQGQIRFHPANRARVFLAYAVEDFTMVEKIASRLEREGFSPWLDRWRLLPGQEWPRCIERAISVSDFFVPCFSTRSVGKRGQFQKELRLALDAAAKVPLDSIFIVPVRLDDCGVPRSFVERYQYVDLFPDERAGLDRLVTALRLGARGKQPTSELR